MDNTLDRPLWISWGKAYACSSTLRWAL